MPLIETSGILIAVEGIDGAGKTTQVELLGAALERVGQRPVLSKEPTNGRWGRLIKESAEQGRMAPTEELDAFIKDRTEHVQAVILPSLQDGRIVILDRYFYSTVAYQGARGIEPNSLRVDMERLFPIPDGTFVLDIDPVLGIYRIAHSRGEKPNHFEKRAELAKAREIFQKIKGPNIFHIDGAASVTDVQRRVLDAFIDGPLKSKQCAKQYGCDDPFHCSWAISNSCEWFRLSRALHSIDAGVV
jgi:dTMP kinase